MKDLFRKYETEFLKFDRVEHKLSQRPDLHAFILLDIMVPGTSDMGSNASHDEIFLAVDPEALRTAPEDQLRELHRCGVRQHDIGQDALVMFI